jgi:hypothetical protein
MRGNFRAILIAVIAANLFGNTPDFCRRLHLTSRIITQASLDQWNSAGPNACPILGGKEGLRVSVAIDAGQSVMGPLLVFPALHARRATITLSVL